MTLGEKSKFPTVGFSFFIPFVYTGKYNLAIIAIFPLTPSFHNSIIHNMYYETGFYIVCVYIHGK